jgi:hypothetical protein
MANREDGNLSNNNAPRRIVNTFQRFAGAVRERARISMNNIRQRARTVRNWVRTQNPEREADNERLPAYQEFVDYPAPLSDAEASHEGEGSFEEYVDDEEEQERFWALRRDRYEAERRALFENLTPDNQQHDLANAGNEDFPDTPNSSDYSLSNDNISAGNTSYDLDSEPASIDESAAQSVFDATSATSNEGSTRDPLDDDISAMQTPSDASSIDEGHSLRRVHVAERVAAWQDALQRQADEHSHEEHGSDSDSLERD